MSALLVFKYDGAKRSGSRLSLQRRFVALTVPQVRGEQQCQGRSEQTPLLWFSQDGVGEAGFVNRFDQLVRVASGASGTQKLP